MTGPARLAGLSLAAALAAGLLPAMALADLPGPAATPSPGGVPPGGVTAPEGWPAGTGGVTAPEGWPGGTGGVREVAGWPGGTRWAGGTGWAALARVPGQLRGAFATAAVRFAVPVAVLAAVAQVESGFDAAAVGPPVPGGPALGMMQFLPGSWQLFNVVPGASPFQPGPAVLAAAHHLRSSGALPGGGWDPGRALYGYNHSALYVAQVLALAGRRAGGGR